MTPFFSNLDELFLLQHQCTPFPVPLPTPIPAPGWWDNEDEDLDDD